MHEALDEEMIGRKKIEKILNEVVACDATVQHPYHVSNARYSFYITSFSLPFPPEPIPTCCKHTPIRSFIISKNAKLIKYKNRPKSRQRGSLSR